MTTVVVIANAVKQSMLSISIVNLDCRATLAVTIHRLCKRSNEVRLTVPMTNRIAPKSISSYDDAHLLMMSKMRTTVNIQDDSLKADCSGVLMRFIACSIVCLLLALVGCNKAFEGSTKPVSSESKEVRLESIIMPAPWQAGDLPKSLPKGWEQHFAERNIVAEYLGKDVRIPKGARYFTFEGKIAIGWHGTYDPPSGM